MSSNQPASRRSGGGISPKLVAVLAAIAVGVVAIFFLNSGGDDEETAPKSNIVKQLKDAGYKMAEQKKYKSDELGQEVTDQFWTRGDPPEQVVITDNSTATTKGVFIVGAVNFGSNGQSLSCQPNPEYSKADLQVIIDGAIAVRDGIANGSVGEDVENSPDFPFQGEAVGCRK